MDISSTITTHSPFNIHYPYSKLCSQYRLPDFISVMVPDDENPSNSKRIVVEIVNDPIIKPFLGGYLNKLTGIEYHNAFSQTGPLIDRSKFDRLVTRDTQTELQPTGGIDVISIQTKFECKDKLEEIENEMATIIQRNYRWHLWKKLIKQSSSEWRLVRNFRRCLHNRFEIFLF